MRSTVYALSALVLISGHTFAQSPAPPADIKRLAGTVQSVSDGKVTIVSNKGEVTEAVIPAGTPLGRGVPATRAELAAAKKVNCNATGVSGELLQATRCGIIPADTKMVNYGHFPVSQGTSRTVGDVASVKDDPSKDLELVLSYKDGQQRIAVPSSAEISKGSRMELSQLKPGDEVVAASRMVDGKLSILAMEVLQK